MNMKRSLSTVIERYGNTISVKGQERTWKALIQPLRYRNKLYVEETAVAAGMIDRTAYLYIGLPEDDLSVYPRGTLFVCDGQLMTMSHAETTCLKDGKEYVWAVFNRYGADDEEVREE